MLPNLYRLDLSNNQITSLPDISLMPKLQVFEFTHNQVTCYPLSWQNHPMRLYVLSEENPGLPSWDDFLATGAGACPQNPDLLITGLTEQLQSFIDQGAVSPQGANAMFNQLEQAYQALCSGKTDHAIQKLEVFINLVRARMPKKVQPAAGEQLIGAAQDIIGLLDTGDFELTCG